MFRTFISFTLILLVRTFSRIFYRHEVTWVGELPSDDRWSGIRLVAILNHTSLFEPILSGAGPLRFCWDIARHGVVPVAKKTVDRPIVGAFFKFIAPNVVPISRKRDDTWGQVLAKVDDTEAMVAIAPEGRMKRADGLDKDGRPMSVRGGIADILGALKTGRMLLVYSEGLHHIQVPGQRLPKLFQPVRMRLEVLDIEEYCDGVVASTGAADFRSAVIADLTRRRDTYCPARDSYPGAESAG